MSVNDDTLNDGSRKNNADLKRFREMFFFLFVASNEIIRTETEIAAKKFICISFDGFQMNGAFVCHSIVQWRFLCVRNIRAARQPFRRDRIWTCVIHSNQPISPSKLQKHNAICHNCHKLLGKYLNWAETKQILTTALFPSRIRFVWCKSDNLRKKNR